MLSADCYVFKDRPQYSFFALERISNFTICSPLCQAKKRGSPDGGPSLQRQKLIAGTGALQIRYLFAIIILASSDLQSL